MRSIYTLLGFLIATALLAACQAPSPPAVARLADNVFIVTHPLRYQIEVTPEVIIVPAGFLTDLASIPRALWWFESPIDRSMAPAVIHDYLYWDQRCTKDEADAVLFVAMGESRVGRVTRNAVYAGVRTPFGDSAFENNGKAKANGEPRFFTREYVDTLLNSPVDPDATLASLEKKAIDEGGIADQDTSNPTLKQSCVIALEIFKSQ